MTTNTGSQGGRYCPPQGHAKRNRNHEKNRGAMATFEWPTKTSDWTEYFKFKNKLHCRYSETLSVNDAQEHTEYNTNKQNIFTSVSKQCVPRMHIKKHIVSMKHSNIQKTMWK